MANDNNPFAFLQGQYGNGVQGFSGGAYQGAGALDLAPEGFGWGSGKSPNQDSKGLFSQMGNLFGSEKFATGAGAFSTLASMYAGFKGLGLAKDTLNFQKGAFNKNFNASAKDYENTLKDRWTARNASAGARGQSFQGMDQWVGDRAIDTSGTGNGKKGG